MENTITLEKNQIIIINGAILNPVIIDKIAIMQGLKNDDLENHKGTIDDSISKILLMSENDDDSTDNEILLLTRNLSYAREYIEDLRRSFTYIMKP